MIPRSPQAMLRGICPGGRRWDGPPEVVGGHHATPQSAVGRPGDAAVPDRCIAWAHEHMRHPCGLLGPTASLVIAACPDRRRREPVLTLRGPV